MLKSTRERSMWTWLLSANFERKENSIDGVLKWARLTSTVRILNTESAVGKNDSAEKDHDETQCSICEQQDVSQVRGFH